MPNPSRWHTTAKYFTVSAATQRQNKKNKTSDTPPPPVSPQSVENASDCRFLLSVKRAWHLTVFPRQIQPAMRRRTSSGCLQPLRPSAERSYNKQAPSSQPQNPHTAESRLVREERPGPLPQTNGNRQRLVRDKVNHKIWSMAVSQNKYMWAMDITVQNSAPASKPGPRRDL